MNATILIVEDECIIALDLRQKLRRQGYAVRLARDGEEAVRLAGEANPDLVLMDIMLGGGMDGIEAAGRIRAARPTVPVVFVSACDDPATRTRAMEAGPSGFISKPVEADALKACIESILPSIRRP